MNLPISVGLNNSQVYTYVDLHGGCRLFVPLHSEGQRAVMSKKLDAFAEQQAWELDHGDSVA